MNIIYLTTCFGTPSHTFIRREINQLRKKGVNVQLFGVRKDSHIAEDATELAEETRYLYPLNLLKIIFCNLYYMTFKPGVYFPLLFECITSKNENLINRIRLLYHFFISTPHAREIEKLNVSHIHSHFLNVATSVTMICSRLTGIPYSATVHSSGEELLPEFNAIPMKLKYASQALMISNYNIEYYDKLYPCRDKSSVVRCGMNLDEFPVRSMEREIGDNLNILAIGRFVEKKGFTYLVKAAAVLKSMGKDFSIEILGSGEVEDELRQEVKDLDVSDCVSLPGFASTDIVRKKILSADLVVVPSVTSHTGEMEGIPVVLMESMALGTPVISTKHSGIPELVTPDTGKTVPEKDEVALAQAIFDYSYSPEKTLNARKLIEDEFNIINVVDRRIEIFDQEIALFNKE